MYQLIQDLEELDLQNLIPDETELEEFLSDYKDYSNTLYNENYHRQTITVDEFLRTFNIYEDDEMSYEDQLNQSLSDILGITKSQLKYIDADLVFIPDKLPEFINIITSTEIQEIESIEIKIKLATFITYLDYEDKLYSKFFDQYYRILSHRPFAEAISLTRTWLDYYDMIMSIQSVFASQDFNNIVAENVKAELWTTFSIFQQKIYLKPSHIIDMHGKIIRFKRLFDSIYEKNDADFKNLMMDDSTNTSVYKKFLYTGTKYSVCSIKNYNELIREGEMLNHCVKEYAMDIIENKCLIYAIRNNQNLDIPLYTIEIKRGKTIMDGTNFRMTQCYGIDDTTDKPQDLYEFIIMWCKLKGITIECEI